MNTDTKILFTDLDDTLLTSSKEISQTNLDAIDRLLEAGHKFVFNTGRPIQSALPLAIKYGFVKPGFYISSFNGGLIYDCYEKKTIHKMTVPVETIKYMFKKSYERGLHCHTYTREYVIAEHETEALKFYSKRIQVPYKVVEDIVSYLPEEPIKCIVMSLTSRQELMTFEQEVLPFTTGKLSSTFSNDMMLEYANPQTTKGEAVRFLCRYFDIPIENSYACGDEENDLTMIQAAGCGVVMKNGVDSIKSYADYITERDNDHDGITEVIEKFFL